MTRHFRFVTVLLTVFALLFANAAMAGYACPGDAKAREVAQMAEEDMPCMETMSRDMDDQQPGFCHAHCQSGHQSADSFQPPVLANLLDLGPVLSLELLPQTRPVLPVVASTLLRRDTGPPLAIQNCCFRI